MLSVGLSIGRSVCLCVRKVYCSKTADWIRIPFGMVSVVGRGIDVLDRGDNRRRGRGSFEDEFGASHCNQWGLCCIVVQERCALPKLFLGGLVITVVIVTVINLLLLLAASLAVNTIERKQVLEEVCRLYHLSVCLSVCLSVSLSLCLLVDQSVRWVNCEKRLIACRRRLR